MSDSSLVDFADGDFAVVTPFSPVQMAVMPLFHMDGERKVGVGTCFCISNQGLCLTARHVVEEAFPRAFGERRDLVREDGNLYALYIEPPQDAGQPSLVGGFVPVRRTMVVDGLDIAAVHLALPIDRRTGRPIRMPANKLGLGPPQVGEMTFALGYHAMEVGDDEEPQDVMQNFAGSRGVVEELHIPRRDSHSLTFPCFRTAARYDGGMSGGPVLGEDGLVRGVVCSSIKLEGEESGHISYASLIAPAMLLVAEASNAQGEVAERILWEFVEGGAVAADTAGVHGKVADGKCRLTFGGMEIANRLGT